MASHAPASIDDILYGGEEGKSKYLETKNAFIKKEEELAADLGQQYTPQSWRGPAEVLWTVQTCSIILAVIIGGGAVVYLKFVLVPLIMAYFVTFLQAPLTDLMEKRPYPVGTKVLCETKFANPESFMPSKNKAGYVKKTNPLITMTNDEWDRAKEREDLDGLKRAMADLIVVGKLPHMAACALTLVLTIAILAGFGMLIASNFGNFLEKEEEKEKNGEEPIASKLNTMLNDQIDMIEQDWGMKIYRELLCPETNLTDVSVFTVAKSGFDVDNMDSTDETMVMITGIDTIKQNITEVLSQCTRKELFGTSEGTTLDDLISQVVGVGWFLNDVILVVILAIYILLERPEGRTISGEHDVMLELEAMVNAYIGMKTMISFATGLLVAIILTICNVQMGIIFGVLAFLLNFIPSVGSIIASLLPIPIIILDDNISPTIQILAIFGPMMVQGYIGNVMEPTLFGKALNVTAISVLLALVAFAFLWGLAGAVISVPLLAAMKIILHHTDHPLAKHTLRIVREDPLVDYEKMKEKERVETLAERLRIEMHDDLAF